MTPGSRNLVLALLLTLALWNVPYGQYALYPFKLFATWLHESSHGLLMLIAGAGLKHMQLYQDTSGLAVPNHGVTTVAQAVISSAGYMGTSLIGAALLVLGRTPRRARSVLFGLGAAMGLTALLFISNPFGIWAIAGFGALLALLGWLGPTNLSSFVVNLLAAQACINAVLDIRILFSANLYVNGRPSQSDAHTVARMVGGPPWLWAVIWMLWSFGLFYLALRTVKWRAERAASVQPAPRLVTPPPGA